MRDAHQHYFAELAGAALAAWVGGNRCAYPAHLSSELDNLYLAVDWAFAEDTHAQRRTLALQVLASIAPLWRAIGHLNIARAQLKDLVNAGDDLSAALRGVAVFAAGRMALWQSDTAQAQTYFDELIRLIQTAPIAPITPSLEWTLAMIGLETGEIASQQNNYGLALTRYTEAYATFVKLDDKWGISEALIGMVRHTPGEERLPQQRKQLEHSVALKREMGDTHGLAMALSWLSGLRTKRALRWHWRGWAAWRRLLGRPRSQSLVWLPPSSW